MLADNKVDISEVAWTNDNLENALAYTQMNCVAANICLSPEAYPWGSGNSFFNVNVKHGHRLGDMTRRGLYQKRDAAFLEREQKVNLAHYLHRFFKADAHQISRLLGFTYSESASILDSFHA